MKFWKLVGYGALIWVIMFAAISAILPLYAKYFWARVATIILSGVLSFTMASFAKPKSAGQAIIFGLTWVITGLILDLFISYQFTKEIFASPYLWCGYFLVLVAPLFRIKNGADETSPNTSLNF